MGDTSRDAPNERCLFLDVLLLFRSSGELLDYGYMPSLMVRSIVATMIMSDQPDTSDPLHPSKVNPSLPYTLLAARTNAFLEIPSVL